MASIIDQLSVLQKISSLRLLEDQPVQQDLRLSDDARQKSETIVQQAMQNWQEVLDDERLDSSASRQQVAEIFRSAQQSLHEVLTQAQLKRLDQIAWQQRGPFAFHDPDLIAALQLTSEQRLKIREAIDADRPGQLDSHGPPHDFPPLDDHGPGRFGPSSRGKSKDRWGHAPEPPHDGHGPLDHGPYGAGGPEFGSHGRGGPGSKHYRGHNGPGCGGDDEYPDMWTRWQHTIKNIRAVLTPEQQAKWAAIVGEPFADHWHHGAPTDEPH